MKTQVTKDYGKFKLLKGNRPINYKHVYDIKDSIRRHGYIPTVAVTNERLEVIDGQHRLQVAQELNLPYYYVVGEGLSLQDAISVNIAQRKWTLQDFIESYASAGNQNYIDLLKDMKKWSVSYIVPTVLYGQPTRNVKNGTLEYKSSRKLDDMIAEALEIQGYIGTRVIAVWQAISKVVTTDGYNHQKMMKNMVMFKGNPLLGPKVDEKGYILMFEEIYNFHARKQLRFY